ncbi:hypothetical protein [Hymenobacter chitinivorans]|uniref:Putative secreted protein with PEP-CTERM sorting signal n=1 Tax=Hymenobacter chitinivorans DSM 11115 TaxID=1121954 RepID=A0A2M9B5B4_9BACT|nr:hypothetical protein [Hymenobacter chitinivorans]PJJ53136.1 putative secreted protein with PEP-CTERM sorting signal [Hymenobacter chitinivorans DSM 11115]
MPTAIRPSTGKLTTYGPGALALLLLGGLGGYYYLRKRFEPAPNQLSVPNILAQCTFQWQADPDAVPPEPCAALLVPVQLPGCPLTCYLQFDTGAPSSLLYAHALHALRTAYPATAAVVQVHGASVPNFSFQLGAATVVAAQVRVVEYGDEELPADSAEPFIIGTLGADVLENRVLVLDYAQRRFQLFPQLPAALARRAVFIPLRFRKRRLLLRATLLGQQYELLFDSGSSAYALITNRKPWKALAEVGAAVQTSDVNSWGHTLTAYTAPTQAKLELGAIALPLRRVTYIQGVKWWQYVLMRASGMGGMLGNEPFRHHTLILDTFAGRFGLIAHPIES